MAAKDSSPKSRASADFVADGQGDQEEINAAIRALPAAGGTVMLAEGTYDIRRVSKTLGGVLIERSNITLAGQGSATRLIQAADQNTNVVRIIGAGIGNVTVRDLFIDANRDRNHEDKTDEGVVRSNFEFNGIKACAWDPRVGQCEPAHDITVRNCEVRNAYCLNVMLIGLNVRCLDNILGNCNSDSVELLGGPGEVRGNYVEITGQTHVAIGSDMGNSIIMADNVVHVKKGGRLDIGFRSWADSQRHVVAGNMLTVDDGGVCTLAMDIRGYTTAITGNTVHTSNARERTRLRITGSGAIVTGNALENVIIEVDDATGANRPIIVRGNYLENSVVEHKKGNLINGKAATQPAAAKS